MSTRNLNAPESTRNLNAPEAQWTQAYSHGQELNWLYAASEAMIAQAKERRAPTASRTGVKGRVIARERMGYVAEPTLEVRAAFDEIAADPNNVLVVGERMGEVVACLQLTFIPGLSRGGMRRALVEAVRVRADLRGQRIGEQLMEDAMARARARGCRLIQLTTDKRREEAHRFYARLGFEASHEGMKRTL